MRRRVRRRRRARVKHLCPVEGAAREPDAFCVPVVDAARGPGEGAALVDAARGSDDVGEVEHGVALVDAARGSDDVGGVEQGVALVDAALGSDDVGEVERDHRVDT